MDVGSNALNLPKVFKARRDMQQHREQTAVHARRPRRRTPPSFSHKRLVTGDVVPAEQMSHTDDRSGTALRAEGVRRRTPR